MYGYDGVLSMVILKLCNYITLMHAIKKQNLTKIQLKTLSI